MLLFFTTTKCNVENIIMKISIIVSHSQCRYLYMLPVIKTLKASEEKTKVVIIYEKYLDETTYYFLHSRQHVLISLFLAQENWKRAGIQNKVCLVSKFSRSVNRSKAFSITK